jgi:hypothetical protein
MSKKLDKPKLQGLFENGNKCELWGRKVPDMDKDELIIFIGFLDELATERHRLIERTR